MILLAAISVLLVQGITMVVGAENLTAITWAHAVNSQELLTATLASNIDMIEADIVLGHLISDPNGPEIPVMGHPPVNTSDISLSSFLQQILDHNGQNAGRTKGVKLDFKSTEVFTGSLAMLTDLWSFMNYPVWLNADIIRGPVNNTGTNPVDANSFLSGCRAFPEAILSIGWTTRWGPDFTEGTYTDDQIDSMSSAIRDNGIPRSSHPITFPVRAGIAAQSQTQLTSLMKAFNETNTVTLTIWSSENDNVDVAKLRSLIFAVGIDKVYVDVPKDLLDQLDLGNPGNGARKLAQLTIMSFFCLSMALFISHLLAK
uniref:Menorin-like domain-containing protein n=1 Tax=Lutzomyia longipalpis TaxID=7200 RepID=A0A7G3AMX4_LUTLO